MVKNMKIRSLGKIIVVTFLISLVSIVLLVISFNHAQKVKEQQAELKQLGLDLVAASDLLTDKAQSYVQYGEQEYLDAYMYEVEVAKNRERVVNRLIELGAPQNELDLVEKAAQLSNTLAELEALAFDAAKQGDFEAARSYIFGQEYGERKTPIVETMLQFQTALNTRASDEADRAQTYATALTILSFILLLGTLVNTIFILTTINKKVERMEMLVDSANAIATGSTDVEMDTTQTDEVGQISIAFNKIIDALKEQAGVLTQIAAGDYTNTIRVRSDYDILNQSINTMLDNNIRMISEIRIAANQVSSGSDQLANGAQALSQGATEQASSIEQLSASIAEVAEQIKQNADTAKQARSKADIAGKELMESNTHMKDMMIAMHHISDKASEISKIIKLIEDIAFQTNILALNAAVEAARAGAAGKGFAVVADEVRNLAAKSAEAAKSTSMLIEETISSVHSGSSIADKTAQSLSRSAVEAKLSGELITRIADASQNQAVAIVQINQGIEQISAVVQTNAATAEESAAASEELSGQASLLDQSIAKFKLRHPESLPLIEAIDAPPHSPRGSLACVLTSDKY